MNMKQLPSSLDAEINILSSIFYNPKKILNVINELSSEDFYFSKNKIIYDALIKLFSEDKPIELISVIEAIGKERLVEVGGVTYITSVIEAGFSGINIEYNIKLLKDKNVLTDKFANYLNSARLLRNRIGHRYKQPKIEVLIEFLEENNDIKKEFLLFIKGFMS